MYRLLYAETMHLYSKDYAIKFCLNSLQRRLCWEKETFSGFLFVMGRD